jgi:rubrerythrin
VSTHGDPETLVESLARNEENIARLYEAYAQRFPESAEFWSDLAAEEMGHAAWIRDLASRAAEGVVHISRERFKQEPINSFERYLRDEIERTQKEQMLLVTALSIALSIEQALLERRFFEVFESDSVELKRLFEKMAVSVEEHIRKVEDCWTKYR